MGDMIDGPTRVVGYYYDDLSPYRQARREVERTTYHSRRPAFPIVTAGFTILALGMSLGVLFTVHQWQRSDDKKFAETIEGRCYETAAGARGVVDTVLPGGKRVELSFPSGVSAEYGLSKLREIPCAHADGSNQPADKVD